MLLKRLEKPGKIDLNKISTDATGGMTKEQGERKFAALAEELDSLQELLYAAGLNGLLVVLQGRDTSGKDGTLTAVAGAMNPSGVRVASFKVPTPIETSHDYLWRVHQQTPGKGEVVFFNRSHYESVLVERVHKLVPEKVWKPRFDQINQFESLLDSAGIIVVKFCLLISKSEQEQRLLEREKNSDTAWKLNVGDWQERKFWDAYSAAYSDVLGKCATPNAPWYAVPADHKWFRNLAIAEALVETLNPYKKSWMAHLNDVAKEQRAALQKLRASEPSLKK